MDKGEFRFAYFSSKYEETIDFYKNIIEFNLKFSWDRGPNDKGSVFGHGLGLIEILKQPDNEQEFNLGLDHRSPKGSFMVIETSNIETIFSKYKKKDINFKQDLTIQDWGHKSFSINDPNGVVLFFFENVE